MAASSVVVLEPGCERVGALVVGLKDAAVSPLGLQRAVEALDFAVLPGAVRPDEDVSDRLAGEEFLERVAAGVVPGVVGHHRL